MDGGPVSAIVRLPDFDKNFLRLTKIMERLEKPFTYMLYTISFASMGVAMYYIRFTLKSSSHNSNDGSSKKDKDSKDKDKERKDKKKDKDKDKDRISAEV